MSLRRFSHFISVHFYCTMLAAIVLVIFAKPVFAIENESANQVGVSLQKFYANGVYGNLFASSFFQNGFNKNVVNYVNFTLGKNAGNSSYASGLYTAVPRANGEREVRIFQQYSYRILFAGGITSFTTNLDQRYFTRSHELGLRSRFRVQWLKPLNDRYSLQLGSQTHFAWNDVERKNMIQRGFRQTRLIFGVNRELANGDRINLNYQARYQNRAFSDNVVQNHVQFLYSRRL